MECVRTYARWVRLGWIGSVWLYPGLGWVGLHVPHDIDLDRHADHLPSHRGRRLTMSL